MEQNLENEALKNLLLDTAASDFAQETASSEPVPVSRRFQRQMRWMVKDPKAWAAKQKKPLWKRFARNAAIVLLTCSIAFGAAIAISPTVRAAVVEWVTEWYEHSILYRFFGEASFESLPRYQITDLPGGYYDTGMTVELPNSVESVYENSAGDSMRFEYMRVEDGSALILSTKNMDVFDIAVGDNPGHLYVSQDPQQSSAITWYDAQSKLQFLIDGFFEEEELITMADSVVLVR